MATLDPYVETSWDTTSYVNPTNMNHIERGITNSRKSENIAYDSNNSVKDKIDSMEIKFQQKSFDSFTIGATTYYDLDITITESGYTPVGIIQWTIFGTGAVTVIYVNIQNSTTARLRVRNNSNETVTSTGGNVTVLYTKS